MAAREFVTSGADGVSRREFLGSATLTAAGIATGLSFYFSRTHPPDLSDFDRPENQVRMGYIGVGNRGGSLLRSSLQAPGCLAIAVADVRESQRQEYLERIVTESRGRRDPSLKPIPYSDYRDLLDNKDVEAVIIATPHYLHGSMAIDALEAGKHVYCEKAMAYTIGENLDLYNLASSKPNLVFQVGHQRRYSPLYQKVKELVDADRIGDIAAMRGQWNQNQVERRPCPDPALEKVINWRLYSEFSGGLSTEFASHQVDVANWLLGTHPESVCGYGGVDWYRDGRDTSDNIHLLFNYRVPVLERDPYGQIVRGPDGSPVHKKENGRTLQRNVRFSYMSMMQNAHLGPSELVLGTKGTIEVCLSGGAEHFQEAKAAEEAMRLADAKKVGPPGRKAIKAGATIAPSCLRRPKGDMVEVPKVRGDWVEYTTPLEGAYDTGETFRAVGAFLDAVRAARGGRDTKGILKADVEVGLRGAVPCLMANIAMRENRTVHWNEFFPAEEAASAEGDRPKRG